MKISVVIVCWNDLKVISNCLESLFAGNSSSSLQVIVSDNGSTDGSIEFIRTHYPQVRLIENNANLGFSKGNNAGIRAAQGEYVLILNPDTIVHSGNLQRWIDVADSHPQAGGFGCRVLNPDGSDQGAPRPFPTVWRSLVAALYLRQLARLSDFFISDTYTGWNKDSEREIDWQSGCCVMFRRSLLEQLAGFDEQFFYHFEEIDLCHRVWDAGYSIIYTPEATITHLGGQSVNRFPIRFAIERERSRYRYFYKHFGKSGARRIRYVALASFGLRRCGYGFIYLFRSKDSLKGRLEMYKAVMRWTFQLDPVRFVESGQESLVETVKLPIAHQGLQVPLLNTEAKKGKI